MAKTSTNQQSKTILSTQALSALGVNKQPFASTILADNEVYFDPALTKIIDSLKHNMQFSSLLLILEGEYGTGKTTLFRYLTQQEIPNIKLLPVQAEASDTLAHIHTKMSMNLDENAAGYLDETLNSMKSFDTIPVLLIDDAHTLSDTVLQEIIRYQAELKQDHETELKIVLFANPGMEKTILKVTPLAKNQLYVQTMPIFDEKQILNFCQHRLLTAGYSGQPLLDNDNAQQILKKSKGIPANILLNAVKHVENKLKKKAAFVPSFSKPLIPVITILIIVSGYVVYFFDVFKTDTLIESQSVENYQLPDTVPVETTLPENIADTPPGDDSFNDTGFLPEPSLDDEVSSVDSPATTDSQPEATSMVQATAPAVPETPAIPEIPIQPEIAEQPVAPAAPEHPGSPRASQVSTVKTVETTPAQSPDSPIILTYNPPAKEPVSPPAKTQAPAPKITKTAPASPVSPTTNPHLAELASMGINNSQWLLQQNPGHWTLQVLGAHDPATLVNFARKHNLNTDTAWYKTQLNGQPWYVMVHRLYSNPDTARASITKLPVDLQNTKPWIKSIASIHQTLKK
ncbi:MAG: AAA family ATPase [Gammaproteobacteria bacterium]|nr:AAA family ATPase [Gammaproteobacteria bacterium]